MNPQNRSITQSNRNLTLRSSLHMVSKEMQYPDPTRHLNLGLNFHRGPGPIPAKPASAELRLKSHSHSGSGPKIGSGHHTHSDSGIRHRIRIRIRNRKLLDGEGGSHVLGPTRFDLTSGYEHKPNLATVV